MKTSSRLTLACVALALLLTSAAIYTAHAGPLPGSASAQTANTGARRKTTRRRRARRRTPVETTKEVPAASSTGTSVHTEPTPVDDEEPPPPPPAPKPTPKPIIAGGVLNGKAISKPQPDYPPIAKAARAQGTVTVQILVDESGRVISASAVSGHPLLQQAAVSAARQARFSPTLLSGQPVKVSGVITYNFVLQ
ncbi:MAG: energy transducer TonB [Pyrinomonadaceae bacterium]